MRRIAVEEAFVTPQAIAAEWAEVLASAAAEPGLRKTGESAPG